ncbi:MAG: hypothetical protein F4Y18_05860 [Cenarchaeum sp. SB0663_bin_5]|nr:hypothetical protein [Cenarchaeum sp. SB0663_bin_5]MYH00752.1 hypothetical protein [Acidimicrobiaceae bacterium]
MDDAELVGGVLDAAPDPHHAAHQLADLLLAPLADPATAARVGLHPELVDVLRARLGDDPDRVITACQQGAAWVLGRRSVPTEAPWDLVASLPVGTDLPPGLSRTTGETMAQLVIEATTTLRLASPFINRPGLSFLCEPLTVATARGVTLEILLPTRSSEADDALNDLEKAVTRDGSIDHLRMSRFRADAPWAHLKVLTADASAAYIGSANITRAGLAGHNLELGVLVRGPGVRVVEQVLDNYREMGTSTSTSRPS